MRHWIPKLFVAVLFLEAGMADGGGQVSPEQGRVISSFDRNWKFHLGDVSGAEKAAFDDSSWRGLDLPHDWMIEGAPGSHLSSMEGPFDKKSPGGAGGGYLNGGVGWYRKSFVVPEADRGEKISILFDGAYMNADIYLNGQQLGNHPYGFTSFSFDLTPGITFGQEPNILAVRLNVVQPCCRWYSGAGLYRHVWLITTQPVHVAQWGTFITTPHVEVNDAWIDVKTELQNEGGKDVLAELTTIIFDPAGREIAWQTSTQELAANSQASVTQDLALDHPQLWAPETPVLYRSISAVRVQGSLTDSYSTSFGIRTIEFKKDEGFFLNGKHIFLKGVCDHHDLGCLGSVALRRGFERQLQILKGMGFNALRTSHNPPSPELLYLCDQMGIFVMDECFDEWKLNKTQYGYGQFFDDWAQKDLVSMLHRDRNHPSIVLWSIGNEVTEGFTPNGDRIAKPLIDTCHREDPTRPVTSACQQPPKSLQYGFDRVLDIFGINYNSFVYQNAAAHARERMIGSETASTISSRGEYGLSLDNQGNVQMPQDALQRNHQVSSYDVFHPFWATDAQQEQLALEKAPWIAGEFVWTGFDYLGEPTPYEWPSRSSYFGILDTCGFPKDRYYMYKSQWSSEPVVHILPHWNWVGFEGKNIPVKVYTNADSVELFLNGRSLGEKHFPEDVEIVDLPAEKPDFDFSGRPAGKGPTLHLAWSVPYVPGVLKAVAKKNGFNVATDEVRTAGNPARIALEPDRIQIAANGQDLSFVKLTILDRDGNVCPNADNEIHFQIEGVAADIAGLDNGDPTNHEPFQGRDHKAFHGLALVVLKSHYDAQGPVTLIASADGLPATSTTVTVVESKDHP